jgi:hypothetical protein
MVSLGKPISDLKLIRKILRSLPERFRIKVTTIEESKDLEEMKIEELVGSLQTIWAVPAPGQEIKGHCSKGFQEEGRSIIWRWLWGWR